jgi:hypothetical protein
MRDDLEMIFEKAKLQVDIARSRDELRQIRGTLEPFMVSKTYGGWSVTSSDGSYLDGWLKAGTRFTKVSDQMTREEFAKYSTESGRTKPILDYFKPTEACLPYLQTIVDTLESEGLYPRRVRLTLLKAGASSDWHSDAPTWMYAVRLHIPIETNSGCIFETETESAHLPADGSVYFLPVNTTHRVKNQGSEDRIHLIADVHDTKMYTEHHRYVKPQASKP